MRWGRPLTPEVLAHVNRDLPRVAVIGAGVIGLSAAWQLAEAGCGIAVYDPEPGHGATHAAAGMLAPVSESTYGEDDVLALGLDSLRRWPEFARRLEHRTGLTVGLRQTGTLVVAHDRDDARELHRFAELLHRQGLAADELTGRGARALEPALSPRTVGALEVRGEHSVDNRLLVSALMDAAARSGVVLHRERAGLVVEGGGVVGVEVPRLGTREAFDVVIVAAGWASSTVPGLPEGSVPAVRPVKGQILRLRGARDLLSRTIRAKVGGQQVYLVPRDTGEVVVGATTEDVGPDTRVTAGAVSDLLRAATTVVPEVAELVFGEALSRLRPTTRDNAPLIGATSMPHLLMATAHYRGGVLMAPATAAALVDLVLDRALHAAVAALSPLRPTDLEVTR